MKLTQKNFDKLVDGMNHRLTNVEIDIKWIKYFGYYITGLITTITLSILGGLI